MTEKDTNNPVVSAQPSTTALTIEAARQKNKLKIVIGLTVIFLLFALGITFIIINGHKETSLTPPPSTSQSDSSTSADEDAVREPLPEQVSYEDYPYISDSGQKYTIKYFVGSKIIGHCEVAVNKPCRSPVPAKRYIHYGQSIWAGIF